MSGQVTIKMKLRQLMFLKEGKIGKANLDEKKMNVHVFRNYCIKLCAMTLNKQTLKLVVGIH